MSGDRRGGGPPGNGDNPGGGWETIGKKKKPGQAAGRGQWAPWNSSSNAPPTTARQPWNGNGSPRPSGNNWAQPFDRRPLQAPNPVVTPPLANGWQWGSRPRPSGPESSKDDVASSDPEASNPEVEDSSDEDDAAADDDMSDDYDSDASEKSFETRKTSKWFKSFFDVIATLTNDQIHEHTRQWHCPACKNGPGAIDWFKGLPSLVTHARTKGSKRVKLHRELAALLEEEMAVRGSSVVQSGDQFGKWKGLRESADREIVWPPMVIVMNTLLEKDDDDKVIFSFFSSAKSLTHRLHNVSPLLYDV
uniref:Uncharacterized protein n=1 Tax=Avena sativa TaxID=4498 RepID=A0ACD5XP52_AVESA